MLGAKSITIQVYPRFFQLMDQKSRLGNKIAAAVTSTFNSTPSKAGKPKTRDNGVAEWTVLAGLVTIDEEDKVDVLTLATGVKALPDEIRTYSNGWMVHDMHAEILCLRMFNYMVLEEVVKNREGSGTGFLEARDGKLQLKEGLRIALYVSEPPCGDASMGYVAQGREAWDEPLAKKQKVESLGTFHRGRESFDTLGVVRTKPGRADSRVTLSKSCSDKLCLRQELGVLNLVTSLFVEPVYLDYIVLGEDKFEQGDFERCFGRIQPDKGRFIEPLVYTEDSYGFHKRDDAVPSPVSLVSCPPLKVTQVLSNGAKNGGFIKNKPPKPSGSSIICNQRLIEKARPLLNTYQGLRTYLDVKELNSDRQALKAALHGVLGNWTPTTPDDFAL